MTERDGDGLGRRGRDTLLLSEQDLALVTDLYQLTLLAALRFTGGVWAVREGTVVLADEPVLRIEAPIEDARTNARAQIDRLPRALAALAGGAAFPVGFVDADRGGEGT